MRQDRGSSEALVGILTGYLQREFIAQCPSGWVARGEVPVLAHDLARDLVQLFGYAPHADVLLEREDGSRRLWIEFEVSRADPVANLAWFATAHLFQPQLGSDSFVAMVSPHVARGRRNLAANTVSLMRHVGMSAFQTVLFPHVEPAEIKRLNHLDPRSQDAAFPAVGPEIDRVFAVAEPVTSSGAHRIYLAGDILDALLNVRRWNEGIGSAEGRALWGKRTVTYFVFDPHSRTFAPAKFCAYLPLLDNLGIGRPAGAADIRAAMTVGLYSQLDSSDTRFDGHRAQTHLTHGLGMRVVPAEGDSVTGALFNEWLRQHAETITVNSSGALLITPPAWFG